MTSANREQVCSVRESTPGTTPNTPRMRKARITGEALDLKKPMLDDPDEISADRMNSDPVLLFQTSGGSINANLSYPVNLSPLSDWIASGMYNEWVNSPERDNDGTADSVITAMTGTTDVVTCTTGAAFVAGHLAKFSGFTTAANNGVFKCTTGHATAPVFLGAGFVAEAAPAAAARIKVVGFQGASGDITATADGLASTLLDFSTFTTLVPGKTIDVGGTASGDRFATSANNASMTIVSVAAHAIVLANKPSGWAVDDGSGKTIKVWFGDHVINGVLTDASRVAVTLEKGFLGQAVPSYIVGTGQTVDSMSFSWKHKDKVRCVFNFKGMRGSESTTALDASPDAVTTGSVFSGNVNVGRLAEGGSLMASPNFCRSWEISVNNNLRDIEDVTADSVAGLNEGECTVETKKETYYGSDGLLTKYFNGTATSSHTVGLKNSQMVAFHVPREIYRDGTPPQASGKNTDVMLQLTGRASRDTTTNAHLIIDRLEYVE